MTDRRKVLAPSEQDTNVERSVPKLYVERAGFGLEPSPSHASKLRLTPRNPTSSRKIQEPN